MDGSILITSIGSFATECVIDSLRSFLPNKMIGCDIYPSEWHVVSKKFDVVYKSPLVKDHNMYFDFVKKTCQRESIKMIIPMTDIDVDFFNIHRSFFQEKGIVITIGSSSFLNIARNKYQLYQFTKTCSTIRPINSYLPSELNGSENYPLIAKPKDGRSSQGIYYLNSFLDLNKTHDHSNYFFQEIIAGPVCTIDYVRSAVTEKSFFIPRRELLRTSNGAGLTIQTFHDEVLDRVMNEVGNKLKIHGCINMEFIFDDEGFRLIDINPRFSAGVGFSKLAGYDFPKSHFLCFMDMDIMHPNTPYKDILAQKVMKDTIINIK